MFSLNLFTVSSSLALMITHRQSTTIAAVIGTLNHPPVTGPITQHFNEWLENNGYGMDHFPRLDYGTQGSFGGRTSEDQQISKIPIIFIHGNSDSGLKTTNYATGWSSSISYFQQEGYTSAELYTTSWEDNEGKNAPTRSHNCANIGRLRRFIEAVKEYTEADEVSIIAHSMGVTMARKAIIGGHLRVPQGSCNLGSPLSYVNTFINLAGANYGICWCVGQSEKYAGCSKNNGLWPGDSCGTNPNAYCGNTTQEVACLPNYSSFLGDLNSDTTPLAKHILSAWSEADELINYKDMAWGRPTSLMPRGSESKIYTAFKHMETKDLTTDDQYDYITKHTLV